MKLHLACGKRDFGNEWIHVDGGDYPHVISHDICNLPYDDNSVDLIYCAHALEYFDRHEVVNMLREWKRVLKENALLRIAVPDFSAIAELYMSGEYLMERFTGPLYGKMKMNGEYIHHKTCYDFVSLASALHDAGFSHIERYNWRDTEHSKFDDHSQAYIPPMDKENGKLISLNVECRKI